MLKNAVDFKEQLKEYICAWHAARAGSLRPTSMWFSYLLAHAERAASANVR